MNIPEVLRPLVRALAFPVPRTRLGRIARDPWQRSLSTGHPGLKRHRKSKRPERARARMKRQSQRAQRDHDRRISSRRGAPTTQAIRRG